MKTNSKSMIYANWVTAFAAVLMAVISGIGIYLLISELSEIRKQNQYLEASLRQTYRPLGYVNLKEVKPDFLGVEIGFYKNIPNKFSLEYGLVLKNYGKGVLYYIGRFSYLTDEQIDFREELLIGRIKNLQVDNLPKYARNFAYLPYGEADKKKLETTIIYQELPFKDKYFIYSIFLYYDQVGNLYDTVHEDVLTFTDPKIAGSYVMVDSDTSRAAVFKDSYYFYNEKEKEKLTNIIKTLNEPKDHNISEFLEKL